MTGRNSADAGIHRGLHYDFEDTLPYSDLTGHACFSDHDNCGIC